MSKLSLLARVHAPAPPPAEAPPEPVVLRGLGHSYGRVAALADVDLTVRRAEVVYLVGPVGAGKSTLLRILHGDLRPSRGEAWVLGAPLHGGRPAARSLRTRVGMVYQDLELLPRLTARENVVYAIQVADLWTPHAEGVDRASALLEEAGLADRMHHYPSELSGGQRQRLAIARAMAARPQVLLADEPTGNLDHNSATAVRDLLKRLADGGTTVIAATHGDTGDARVVRMDGGRVSADSRPAEALVS